MREGYLFQNEDRVKNMVNRLDAGPAPSVYCRSIQGQGCHGSAESMY